MKIITAALICLMFFSSANSFAAQATSKKIELEKNQAAIVKPYIGQCDCEQQGSFSKVCVCNPNEAFECNQNEITFVKFNHSYPVGATQVTGQLLLRINGVPTALDPSSTGLHRMPYIDHPISFVLLDLDEANAEIELQCSRLLPQIERPNLDVKVPVQ